MDKFIYSLIIAKEENNETIAIKFLFNSGDYIAEIHDYIKKEFNLILDKKNPTFEVELMSEHLNELYKIIDDYCLKLAQKNENRYIDILKNYNDYNQDFGNYNLKWFRNNPILESANLCRFLTEDAEGVYGNYFGLFRIYGNKVIFRYS